MEIVERPRILVRGLGVGIGVGVLAGMAMAVFAMGWNLASGKGFFTPLYHIASVFTGGEHMMRSMKEAMGGDPWFFSAGAAVLGFAIHMGWSMAWGALFGALVYATGLRGGPALGTGVLYGLAVMLFMSFPPPRASSAGATPSGTCPRWRAGFRSHWST